MTFSYEGLKIPYVIAGHYTPDFVIATPTGRLYIETKGYLRPEDKRKLIAVKKCNPNMDLRIVFYEHKPRSVKWAEKNHFKYAIGNIPEEWLKGF